MTQYVLQAHRNRIDGKIPANHSGYDLITYHDDGRITIESLDLNGINNHFLMEVLC